MGLMVKKFPSQPSAEVEFEVSSSYEVDADVFISNEALPPILMVHGEPLLSYNDGSYFVETRSTRRPNEWIKRDT